MRCPHCNGNVCKDHDTWDLMVDNSHHIATRHETGCPVEEEAWARWRERTTGTRDETAPMESRDVVVTVELRITGESKTAEFFQQVLTGMVEEIPRQGMPLSSVSGGWSRKLQSAHLTGMENA